MNTNHKLNLRQVLDELDISVKDFSERSGISREALYRMMNNPKGIQFATITKICNTAGIEIGELIVRSPNGS